MKPLHVKRLSMSLSCLLAISMLAACSDGGSGSKTAAPAPAADPKAAPKAAEPEKPLTVKIFAGLYNDAPDMNNAYWTEWQKRTNSKLEMEWVPSGDIDTKMDLVLASGDLPEILSSPNANRPSLINAAKNGAFWDLGPFLGDFKEYPNLKNNLAKDALKYLSVDGKVYALPRSRSRVDLGLKIRKDWLDKLNIPVPTTLDEYAAALKKITDADLDGNGKKDTLGIIGQGVVVDDGTTLFAAGFGALNPTYNEEGGMIETRLTPQWDDMIAYFRQMYSDGGLPKEFSVMKRTQNEELFRTGKAASYTNSIWWDDEWEKENRKTQPDAKILNLLLKGPKGDYALELQTGVSGGYYISKKVPEARVKQLLKYLEQTASQEMTDFAYYGIEGVHYKVVDGQKTLTEQGVKEVNVTSKGAGVLAYSKWGKVISASGSKAFNDAKIKEVEKFDELGLVDPFRGIISPTWLNTWPKYESEWKTMEAKAIVGQISMDEFKAYTAKLRALPEMKKAFKEFSDAYKTFTGK
ncbi:extracellular solute-binding protein [Paenibacillus sp. WQ 127069]|jgi:putative aldouronate transport system substrate-binding protein|uniref:Extracellular solute-binding protein n=1 Tax=Paenibacillus baimaensis TaxID=2982185 RepID=A0ABT2UHB7_9BACL|nr:extracellular solute-binding protein [Paenibacillus sp. WQ 127069]MCU6794040.1 extracellular solute-binding protein [Paenibacillus sp. WQ 127069]